MKTKTGHRVGLRHAGWALLIAYGSRIAWWSSEFDPLILLTYAIIVLGMVAMFMLFHEMAEAREKEFAVEMAERAPEPAAAPDSGDQLQAVRSAEQRLQRPEPA